MNPIKITSIAVAALAVAGTAVAMRPSATVSTPPAPPPSTTAPHPIRLAAPPAHHPDEVQHTLGQFMDARMHRDDALATTFLSAHAKAQFEQGRNGLALSMGVSNPHYDSWGLVARTQRLDGSTRYVVRIHVRYTGYPDDHPFLEVIRVGRGRDYTGRARAAVILAANRS